MSICFTTELNNQESPQRKSIKRQHTQPQHEKISSQLNSYINTLDSKINSVVLEQLTTLKIKHLELGGVLSGMQAERNKIIKKLNKKQEDFKKQFQEYMTKDIQKFKNHKQFFTKYFNTFSLQLNQAIDKRDKLKIYVQELRKKHKQIKRNQLRRYTQSVALPSIVSQLKTSKTLRTTQCTERSIRVSTDIFEPMSPILKRLGGSQPVLTSSRLYQPIKSQSTSTKRSRRKDNINLLRQLFKQRNQQKKNLSNFEKVLFQRRNFDRLMEFFDCMQFN